RLPVRALGVGQLVRARGHAQGDGGEDEGDPSERGGLPVCCAPPAGPPGEIPVHLCLPRCVELHTSRLPTCPGLDNPAPRRLRLVLPPGLGGRAPGDGSGYTLQIGTATAKWQLTRPGARVRVGVVIRRKSFRSLGLLDAQPPVIAA